MRLRVVGWTVQPVLFADDGETLTPVTVNPTQIPLAQWEAFKAGGDATALRDIERQIVPTPTEQMDPPSPSHPSERGAE